MELLEQALLKFKELLEKEKIDLQTKVVAKALGVREALGDPNPYRDFALQRGVEKLMDIEVMGSHGQAFTSYPSTWHGTLEDVLKLPLQNDRNRALIIGTMNSVTKLLGISDGTIHCKDSEPDRCGREMAARIAEKLEEGQILGIIGYQPAILKNMVEELGAERVRVTDLNLDNIGEEKYGVKVWDGDSQLLDLAHTCDLCIATGSTMTNGSTDVIMEVFERENKEVIFFGTTIAGPASLLNLKRICPLSC